MPIITHNADQTPKLDVCEIYETREPTDEEFPNFKEIEAAHLSYEILENKTHREDFIKFAANAKQTQVLNPVIGHLYWKAITLQDMHVDNTFLDQLELKIQELNSEFKIPRPLEVTIIEEGNNHYMFTTETGHSIYTAFSPDFKKAEFVKINTKTDFKAKQDCIILPKQSITNAILDELAHFIGVTSPSWLITKKYETFDEVVNERSKDTLAVLTQQDID